MKKIWQQRNQFGNQLFIFFKFVFKVRKMKCRYKVNNNKVKIKNVLKVDNIDTISFPFPS